MKMVGNVLWVILGGLLLAILWGICGVVCSVTIIGIPVGLQCFKFARFVLWPFGKNIYYSNNLGHFMANVLWAIIFGWGLAIASIIIGLVLCITIIGIPFGIQSFKFAQLALMPFGAEVI